MVVLSFDKWAKYNSIVGKLLLLHSEYFDNKFITYLYTMYCRQIGIKKVVFIVIVCIEIIQQKAVFYK